MEVSDIDVPFREAVSAVWDSVRPELGWTLEFVLDDPGPALVTRSAEAALLVVGTHEHVGLARLVSGSVSRYCLSHAKCPTVIVPVDNRAVSLEQTERPTAGTRD
jgi:nucleotide-binding universal stress UspA family protein